MKKLTLTIIIILMSVSQVFAQKELQAKPIDWNTYLVYTIVCEDNSTHELPVSVEAEYYNLCKDGSIARISRNEITFTNYQATLQLNAYEDSVQDCVPIEQAASPEYTIRVFVSDTRCEAQG